MGRKTQGKSSFSGSRSPAPRSAGALSTRLPVPPWLGALCALLVVSNAAVLAMLLWPKSESPPDEKVAPQAESALADPASINPLKPRSAVASSDKGAPWGKLQWSRIDLAPSKDYVTLDLCPRFPEPWILPGGDEREVAALLDGAHVRATERKALLEVTQCKPGRCTIYPTLEVITGLDREERGVIYRALGQYAENSTKLYAYRFVATDPTRIFEGSSLKPETRKIIADLVFPGTGYFLFADLYAACQLIKSADEKLEMLRAVSRTSALLVWLKIDPDTDVDDLIDYWGSGRRTKDIRPLLESLTRVPGGVSLDIAHLLPPFARARLNTYPKAGDPPRDCHWTSMNFWGATADDRFVDPEQAKKELEANYHQVDQANVRFGDVVVFMRPGGQVIHSAVYVAEDILFTKNGRSARKPWVMVKLNDVIVEYFNEMALDVLFYRSNAL